jgi:hypothetical protein
VDEKSMLNIINEMCNNLLLTQVVTGPTHKDGNTLDLVFVNNLALVHNTTAVPVLQSTSHHSIIQISTTYKAHTPFEQTALPKKSGLFASNFFHKDVQWDKLQEKLAAIDLFSKFFTQSIAASFSWSLSH